MKFRLLVPCIATALTLVFTVPAAIAAGKSTAPKPAAPALTNLPSANGLIWDINESEGHVFDGNQDAFDNYGSLGLNVRDGSEVLLQAPVVVDSLGLVLSGSNRMVTTTPFVAAGVSISRELWAIPGTNVLRYLDSLTNTTGSVRKVRIAFGGANGDLGSDDQTRVAATSSGDRIITTADNWMVSIQGAVDYTSVALDPPVGVAWSNRAAAAFIGGGNTGQPERSAAVGPLTTPFAGDGDDAFSPVYELVINPGATVRLMHYVYRGVREETAARPQGTTAAGDERLLAVSVTSALVTSPLVSDLSPSTLASIVNWTFEDPSRAVPVNSPWALIAALLLMIVAAFRALRPANRGRARAD